MSIRYKGGQYPRVLTMMEAGMTYTEYELLKETSPKELLTLYYFIIERKNDTMEKLSDKNKNKNKKNIMFNGITLRSE